METYVWYLLKSTTCLVTFYILYLVLFRRQYHFHVLRFYLLSCIVLSLILPLNKAHLALFPKKEASKAQTETPINAVGAHTFTETEPILTSVAVKPIVPRSPITYNVLLGSLYLMVCLFFILRFLLSLGRVFYLLYHSTQQRICTQKIYFTDKTNTSFSFFGLVFVSNELRGEQELDKILAHENIHVSQFHSFDVLLIELLSAVMWFNPVIWWWRKTIGQVHEYLADEGVLNTGFDRLEYQALLINHAAEDRLILSSNFNQSLIKKRILMMTEQKSNSNTKVRLLSLIPISMVLFVGIASTNVEGAKVNKLPVTTRAVPIDSTEMTTKLEAEVAPTELTEEEVSIPKQPIEDTLKSKSPITVDITESKVLTAVAPLRMNVFYIGLENPVAISVSGINSDRIGVTINNGTIKGGNGEYKVQPSTVGNAIITVTADGKIVSEANFRVKPLPSPVAYVCKKKGGRVKREDLLAETEVKAVMENFDFDAQFTIKSFTFYATTNSFSKEEKSNSNQITENMKKLIKSANKDDNVGFVEITCVGPDGIERMLPAGIVLKIED